MRALDGYSERQMRESGDKSAGQSLAREAIRLEREQHLTKQQDGKQEQNETSRQKSDQRTQRQGDLLNQRQEQSDRQRQDQSDKQRLEQQQNDRAKNENKPGKPDPSTLDSRHWQKDANGNFVTRAKDGRLLTHDDNGKLVDYKSELNQKHMANQDQMAFTSILFCNPLMLFGMGAAFAMMDQAHASKTARMAQDINQKFDGKVANKQAMQNGYAGDIQRKAMLIQQYTRPMDGAQMNGLAGMNAASMEREELRKQEVKRKQRIDDKAKRPQSKVSMPTDRYAMSAKKLMKTKRLLEDEIERVRGKASLEEVSKLYAQVEVLDKALKRMANF